MIHLPADLISLELSREDLIAIPASSPDSVPVTSASLGPQHTTAITVNLQEPTVIYLAVYFLLGETVKKTGEKVPLLEFFMLVLYLSKHVWASLVAQTVGNPPAVCVYQRASQTVPVVKNPPANAGRSNRHEFDGCIRKIPGGGHSHPLRYPCLKNPMDRGAWQAALHSVAQSPTQLKRLSMNACMCIRSYEKKRQRTESAASPQLHRQKHSNWDFLSS